jgi:hypothetical protein
MSSANTHLTPADDTASHIPKPHAQLTTGGTGPCDLRVPISDSPTDEFQQPSLLRQLWFDDQQYLAFKLDLFLSGTVTTMDYFSFGFIAAALVYQVYRFIFFFSAISIVRVLQSDGSTSSTPVSNAIFNLLVFSNIVQVLSICLCLAWVGIVLSLRSTNSLNSTAPGSEPPHYRCLSDFLGGVNRLALAWKHSSHRELLFESAAFLFPLSACLQLFAHTHAGACVPGSPTAALLYCIPASGTLPSGRVFLAFIAPIMVQSVAHLVRVRSVLINWLMTCAFVFASAARIEDLALEFVHILSALICLFIILRMDQFGRECHVVHMRELALQDAARRLELAESRAINARLEIEVLKTEKQVLESSSKEICTLMGNVAHDLKTPIQAISTGLELLRYLLCGFTGEQTNGDRIYMYYFNKWHLSRHLYFSFLFLLQVRVCPVQQFERGSLSCLAQLAGCRSLVVFEPRRKHRGRVSIHEGKRESQH